MYILFYDLNSQRAQFDMKHFRELQALETINLILNYKKINTDAILN